MARSAAPRRSALPVRRLGDGLAAPGPYRAWIRLSSRRREGETVRSVMVRVVGSGLLLSLAAACSDPSPICTADSRPGIEVEVRERTSNQFISELARGVAQDGAFQDSVRLWGMTGD